jgi:hypothetical protein
MILLLPCAKSRLPLRPLPSAPGGFQQNVWPMWHMWPLAFVCTGHADRALGCSVQVTAPGGLLALSSCSSQLGMEAFLGVCEQALGRARRRGVVLEVLGQPADHPFPIACQELRYLKFALFQLD